MPTTRFWGGRTLLTAAQKMPVDTPVELLTEGLEGDEQADRAVHGGPDKAVLAYAAHHYDAWRLEGVDLPPGGFFENLTVSGDGTSPGPDETRVRLGDVWRIGTAILQVSQPRRPCFKLALRWGIPDLVPAVQDSGRSGWYLRVLSPGTIAPGDAVVLLERRESNPTVADVARVMADVRDLDGARRLVDLDCLPEQWRGKLARRLAGRPDDESARTRG